jgi:hypothetical protein
VQALAENMRTDRGFDPACPIRVWNEGGSNTVLDGHMRLKAAGQTHITMVPILSMEFPDDRAALEWVFKEQTERRRNLTKAEMRDFQIQAIRAIDAFETCGGDRKSAAAKIRPPIGGLILKSSNRRSARSAHRTAAAVSAATGIPTSARTVERVRSVDQYGDEATKAGLGKTIPLDTADKQVRRTFSTPKKPVPMGDTEVARGKKRVVGIAPSRQAVIDALPDPPAFWENALELHHRPPREHAPGQAGQHGHGRRQRSLGYRR